jgi:hydrogenase nickel incorporation protein HypA/HybF
MHETGIVRDLVRRLETTARDAGAKRVSNVEIRLGALSQFSEDHFREHFVEEARGTLAEGANLKVETSEDVSDPNAQQVVLWSVDLEVPDEAG